MGGGSRGGLPPLLLRCSNTSLVGPLGPTLGFLRGLGSGGGGGASRPRGYFRGDVRVRLLGEGSLHLWRGGGGLSVRLGRGSRGRGSDAERRRARSRRLRDDVPLLELPPDGCIGRGGGLVSTRRSRGPTVSWCLKA